MTWDGEAATWWAAEVETDPAYGRDVDPLLRELMPVPAGRLLDLGCGTGRLLTAGAVGVDASVDLLQLAAGNVVAADIKSLPFDAASFDTAYAVLVLEHLEDPASVFGEVGRVVKPGGRFVMVLNHPIFTAPGSGPLLDTDGEVLWRVGAYLRQGHSDEPAGPSSIRFHHRPLGSLMTVAAETGWLLERLEERPAGDAADSLLAVQGNVPRLLGVRWRRL